MIGWICTKHLCQLKLSVLCKLCLLRFNIGCYIEYVLKNFFWMLFCQCDKWVLLRRKVGLPRKKYPLEPATMLYKCIVVPAKTVVGRNTFLATSNTFLPNHLSWECDDTFMTTVTSHERHEFPSLRPAVWKRFHVTTSSWTLATAGIIMVGKWAWGLLLNWCLLGARVMHHHFDLQPLIWHRFISVDAHVERNFDGFFCR